MAEYAGLLNSHILKTLNLLDTLNILKTLTLLTSFKILNTLNTLVSEYMEYTKCAGIHSPWGMSVFALSIGEEGAGPGNGSGNGSVITALIKHLHSFILTTRKSRSPGE